MDNRAQAEVGIIAFVVIGLLILGGVGIYFVLSSGLVGESIIPQSCSSKSSGASFGEYRCPTGTDGCQESRML